MITADTLCDAILKSDSERRPIDQAYIDETELGDFLVSGRINLVRVAEIVNEKRLGDCDDND